MKFKVVGRFNKQVAFDSFIIFMVGLIPLLWFKGDTVILGHDAGLSFQPITHFIDRLHIWSQRFGIGTDQSPALLGAFLIHGIEAFLSWVGFSLQTQQKIQFIFWFTLPGFAMYFFAGKIWPNKRYLPIIASIIYMVNFYLLQGWFIAERTKFSIYIAFPLVMYCLIYYLTGRMKFLPAITISGIILGIFNGGGSFPLYGGLALAVLITYAYFYFLNTNFSMLRKIIAYSFGTGIIYFLLNAYWLIPYIFYLSGFAERDLALAGGTEGALEWARYLSAESTFINLFRGQGIPDWYLNPYHAFSGNFFANPLLITISFLLPILAFASLLFVKVKKDAFYIYLFVLFTLAGILFSSGPESQLGIIYETLVRYIPGFAMFRSAFYKFNYVVWFSYGILIGFSLDHILSFFQEKYFVRIKSVFSAFAIILIVTGYIVYHYPILSGSFFDYSREPGHELTTRISVPDYVFEFGEWVNQQNPNKRFLIMPQLGDTNYINYRWNYWSIAPVTSLISRNSFVHNNALIPQNERLLMNEMYAAFLRNDMDAFTDFTDVFAIDAIILHKDVDWQNKRWGTFNPARYESILDSSPFFSLEKEFGQWKVYNLTHRSGSLRINATDKINFLQGKLANVVSHPNFDPKAPLFMSDIEQDNIDYYINNATEIFLAPECSTCDFESDVPGFKYYNPTLLPGSILYKLISSREEAVKNKSNDFMSMLNYYIAVSNRRIIEVKWMVDSKTRISLVLPTLNRYYQLLTELNNHLSPAEWMDSASQENIASQLIINHILQQINLIDSMYNNDVLGPNERQAIAQAYDQILKIEKKAREKLWITEELENKKYIYDMPKLGEYDVYIKRSSLTNPENEISDITVTTRDSLFTLEQVEEIEDWLYFGAVNIANKKLLLNLNDTTVSNILDNADLVFPDGEEGIIQEENNFVLTADSLNNCFYYQVDNLDTTQLYLISFDYRNFSDKFRLAFIFQQDDEQFLKYNARNSFLENSRALNKFTRIIPIKESRARLNFCNGFLSLSELRGKERREELDLLSPEGRLVEIKNISFQRLAFPNVVLYQKQKDLKGFNNLVAFTKNDPVTYTVELADEKARTALVMRESYGRYWRVCNESNKCLPFNDKSHFASAGFANAWYFKEGFGNKLIFYYYPQFMFVVGTIITVVSGFIIISIIIGKLCWRLFARK